MEAGKQYYKFKFSVDFFNNYSPQYKPPKHDPNINPLILNMNIETEYLFYLTLIFSARSKHLNLNLTLPHTHTIPLMSDLTEQTIILGIIMLFTL
jgi:hypothetical protein